MKFGVLFNDDRCANIFEALVGTLKAAKKRKVINFQGELLLQGVHDNVDIILLQEWGQSWGQMAPLWVLSEFFQNTELRQCSSLSLSSTVTPISILTNPPALSAYDFISFQCVKLQNIL